MSAEPISRDQILRRERGQGNINISCSAGNEQDWQPYAVDPLHVKNNKNNSLNLSLFNTQAIQYTTSIYGSTIMWQLGNSQAEVQYCIIPLYGYLLRQWTNKSCILSCFSTKSGIGTIILIILLLHHYTRKPFKRTSFTKK